MSFVFILSLEFNALLCFCCSFQAIECFLANVKSTKEDEVDVWQPEAISRFEEVTHGRF